MERINENERMLKRHGSQFSEQFSYEEGFRILRKIQAYISEGRAVKIDHLSENANWSIGSGNRIRDLYLHPDLMVIALEYSYGSEPDGVGSALGPEEGGEIFTGIEITVKGADAKKVEGMVANLEKLLYEKSPEQTKQ